MTNKNNEIITIAIVEDHPAMRSTIRSMITGFGFNVVFEAGNGAELLERLGNSSALPDVCFLDINTPIINGYETVKLLRENYPEVKVAALTSNREMHSFIKMIKSGASSYLTKNTDPTEWKHAIISLVEKGYYCSDWMGSMLLEHIRSIN